MHKIHLASLHYYEACRYGMLEIILSLISLGADVNQKDSDGCIPVLKAEDNTGRTVLHEACQHGQLDIVRMLCELRADVYKEDSYGNTSMSAAIVGDHGDVVEALITSFGYNIHAQNTFGITPLYEACRYGMLEIILSLISLGADVNQKDSDGCIPVLKAEDNTGRTVLHEACQHGRLDIVRMLCELRADVYKEDSYGNTSMSAAIVGDHGDVVEALITSFGYNIHAQNTFGITPLYEACRYGMLEIILSLISLGADVNQKDSDGCIPVLKAEDKTGRTVLHEACQHGRLDIVRMLCGLGADIYKKDMVGNTPIVAAIEGNHYDVVRALISEFDYDINRGTLLHEACKYGRLEIVTLLIQKWADVYKKDMVGNTPIVAAIEGNHDDIVRVLISFGYAINRGTLLHDACKQGRLDMVRRLIGLGADVYKEDHSGITPMMAVIESNHCHIMKAFVKEFGFEINTPNSCGITPLAFTCQQRHYYVLALKLIDMGASVDLDTSVDKNGRTLLHEACRRGQHSTMKILMELGADVNVEDAYGNTPMFEAIEGSHSDVVKAACELGYDVNAENSFGRTPLSKASELGMLEILVILIQCGADVTMKDSDGFIFALEAKDSTERTLLHEVCRQGELELVKRIVKLGANMTVEDAYGTIPLYEAMLNNHNDIVEALITEFGFPVNCILHPFGTTALHEALHQTNFKIASTLISMGADVNVKDKNELCS